MNWPLIGRETPVVFHAHEMDEECGADCADVSTAPWDAPEPRLTRLEHNHVKQSHNLAGEPGCEACAEIDPLKMIGDPRQSKYVVG